MFSARTAIMGPMEQDFIIFEKFVRSDWFGTAVGVVVILFITVVICRILVVATRKVINKTTLLPSSSIFVNLVRALVWLIGISCILSICFNVDVSAIITALGVGGIAVSLGMQDTVSNLIGGFQVSVARIVKPGDNIQLGTLSGIKGRVTDVTLRYTHIVNSDGDRIVIPNSMLNSNAIVHLDPILEVNIPVVVTYNEERLSWVAHHMEDACAKAVARVSKLKKKPQLQFTAITEFGYKGDLFFTISEPERIDDATDAAIRAIAPYAHAHPMEQMMDAMEEGRAKKGDVPVPKVLKAVDSELASEALLQTTGKMVPVGASVGTDAPTAGLADVADAASAAQPMADGAGAEAATAGASVGMGEEAGETAGEDAASREGAGENDASTARRKHRRHMFHLLKKRR